MSSSSAPASPDCGLRERHGGERQTPGLRAFGFDVDSYDSAVALEHHLRSLAERAASGSTAATVVVIGAGLTGIETAAAPQLQVRPAIGH